MSTSVILDQPLSWRQVAAVAEGAPFSLSARAESRIRGARLLVESIVAKGIRAYGVNTGVGALCDVIVEPSQLRHLSRNIVMSHAVGVGAPLSYCEVRAIMAAAINNFAHGYSGVRLDVVDRLMGHLRNDWIPEVPAAGSVGYLSHMAHVALAVIGEGYVQRGTERRSTREVLKAADIEGLVLEAKEGLSLVNGTPCVTGLTALALLRAERLLNWADVIAAMSFENLRGQSSAFDAESLRLRASPAVSEIGERLQALLDGSGILAASAGRRTQDALSLRAIPHVHGAAREVFAMTAAVVDTELRAITDNPVVVGTEDEPRSLSQANAVGAAIGLSADALGVAIAELAAMSERRLDRLVNPLVSGLPAFLASDSGAGSGFMIAQYTAASLVADNRRLAAPASLDGGVTSGLQEDHLCHATPAALKLLKILDNAEFILSIELLAAIQAYDLQPGQLARAPNTDIVYRALRGRIPHYRDERPLARDIERVREIIREPTAVDFESEVDEEPGRQSAPPRQVRPETRPEVPPRAAPTPRVDPVDGGARALAAEPAARAETVFAAAPAVMADRVAESETVSAAVAEPADVVAEPISAGEPTVLAQPAVVAERGAESDPAVVEASTVGEAAGPSEPASAATADVVEGAAEVEADGGAKSPSARPRAPRRRSKSKAPRKAATPATQS
jgi:histidine ammonia-lyase